MSDGYLPNETPLHLDVLGGHCDDTSRGHVLDFLSVSASTGSQRQNLLEWLPRLGPVLWLAGRTQKPAQVAEKLDSDLLIDHPSIVALATYSRVRLHHRITSQGPREWLAFDDATGVNQAKIFLLPDSDFLAWDRMCTDSGLEQLASSDHEPPSHASFLRRALARLGHRGQASLLQFEWRKKLRLRVLDAHSPLRISLLAIDIVRNIARDEHAEWLSPWHQA